MELFGFELTKKKDLPKDEKTTSFVEVEDNDGALSIDDGINTAFAYDFEVSYTDDKALIEQYRLISEDSEVEWAIDDIINEAISFEPNKPSVTLDLSETDLSDNIKEKIKEEFDNILGLLNFDNKGDEILRSWYVDGRLFYHKIINKDKPKDGLKELRRIDATKIKKVRESKKTVENGIELFRKGDEYYIYTERNDDPKAGSTKTQQVVKIPADAITYVHSGLYNEENNTIHSYLHKAIRPFNQLTMMESSAVIYRIARAPERRVFYVDVGNLPKSKAEQFMKGIMNNYKNKMVYDAKTGNVKDNRHHMSMLEDIWLPRREGSRGTEVTTLQGGANLGEMDEVVYFKRKLYKALHIPSTRIDEESIVGLGRSNEITRDEIKFSKFVEKLRKKFSYLFSDMLKSQLMLKNIITIDDWEEIKNDVEFEYNTDQYFAELKEAEILTERMNQLTVIDDYVGRYFSLQYVRENVLRMSEDDQKDMDKQIAQEIKDGKIPDPSKVEEEGGGGF